MIVNFETKAKLGFFLKIYPLITSKYTGNFVGYLYSFSPAWMATVKRFSRGGNGQEKDSI